MKGLVLKIILCLQKITCSHVFAIEPAVFQPWNRATCNQKLILFRKHQYHYTMRKTFPRGMHINSVPPSSATVNTALRRNKDAASVHTQ